MRGKLHRRILHFGYVNKFTENIFPEIAEETLPPCCRGPAQRPIQPTVAPGTYLLRRTRATEFPSDRRQLNHSVKNGMVKKSCGKCLRVNNLMYLFPYDIQICI